MSVLTAFEIHEQMIEAARQVDACVEEYKRRADAYAIAKHGSEMAQAIAFPSTKGTVDERKATVMRMCGEVMLMELQADALKNSADRALKAALAKLSAIQSSAAALRAELQLVRTDNYS